MLEKHYNMCKSINKLYNFFFAKNNKFNKKENEAESSKNLAVCKLSFDINKDGTIDIVCHWPEFNDSNIASITNIAYFYALAIHALSSGFLEKEILKTLQSTADHNEYDTLFVQNVIFKMYEIEKSQKYQYNVKLSDEPLVSPLDVFKNNQ